MALNSFVTLDDPSASFGTYAYDINKSGEVAGYYVDASGHENGFVYNNGVYITVDDPSATDAVAQTINDLGQIAGYWSTSSSADLGFTDVNGTFTSHIVDPYPTFMEGSNDQGVIVGYYQSGGTDNGFAAYAVNSGAITIL